MPCDSKERRFNYQRAATPPCHARVRYRRAAQVFAARAIYLYSIDIIFRHSHQLQRSVRRARSAAH